MSDNIRDKFLAAQRAALDTDAAWSAELQRLFGKRAGDVRYTAKGQGEPGTELRRIYDARVAATKAWEELIPVFANYTAPAIRIRWKEVSSERYWDMLGAVPPALQTGLGFLLGEAHSHRYCSATANMAETFRAFVEIEGRFFEATVALTAAEFRAVVGPAVTANVVEG